MMGTNLRIVGLLVLVSIYCWIDNPDPTSAASSRETMIISTANCPKNTDRSLDAIVSATNDGGHPKPVGSSDDVFTADLTDQGARAVAATGCATLTKTPSGQGQDAGSTVPSKE